MKARYVFTSVLFSVFNRLKSESSLLYNLDSGHRVKLMDMGRKCEQTGQYDTKGSGETATPYEIERS